ncbi:hypothetical protein [Tenacibaculum sp. UWU-22]|uniref:cytidylyltransferase domain-containing protein n=1 Tax=Tenacibaculum sp. UWU-22 TaxID=3234187 RepID=UPI0034DB547A
MEKGVGIIIQARLSSTRLPNKIILEVEKDKISFLDVLLQRIIRLRNLFPIILATSTAEKDDLLVSYAKKYKIGFFRGDENNVLERFIKCAEKNNIKTIIRICSDNPFIDIDSIIALYTEYKGEDYFSYKVNNLPSILTHYGFFSEIVSLKGLKTVSQQMGDECIEHVTNCIYKFPNKFTVRFLENNIVNTDIRCTLDTIEDFNLLKYIYTCFVKQNPELGYKEVIKFIETQPNLLNQMKKLIRKNKK